MRALICMCVFIIGCGQRFDPRSLVNSVRILSAKSDHPYAKPGQLVSLEVLAVDQRPDKPEPMQVYWIPVPCTNPPGDNYIACLPAFGAALPSDLGTDLTPSLHVGTTFSVMVPPTIIARHPVSTTIPYGITFVFTIACAGHLQPIAHDTANPQAPPIGCFDSSGKQLGPNDYVFGFSRIYAYADVPNSNPVITSVTLDGAPIDPAAGITITACKDKRKEKCTRPQVEVSLADGAQELNPLDLNDDGSPKGEDVTAVMYTTIGAVSRDSSRLYNVDGLVPDSGVGLIGTEPGDGTLWIVVHDNRDGATWTQFDVHVR